MVLYVLIFLQTMKPVGIYMSLEECETDRAKLVYNKYYECKVGNKQK